MIASSPATSAPCLCTLPRYYLPSISSIVVCLRQTPPKSSRRLTCFLAHSTIILHRGILRTTNAPDNEPPIALNTSRTAFLGKSFLASAEVPMHSVFSARTRYGRNEMVASLRNFFYDRMARLRCGAACWVEIEIPQKSREPSPSTIEGPSPNTAATMLRSGT